MLEETVTHATLEYLLRKHELTNQEALSRMRDLKHILFMDTLSRFLNLTKLLTFTSGIPPENQPKKIYAKIERNNNANNQANSAANQEKAEAAAAAKLAEE